MKPLTVGAPPEIARAAVVLVHGRGGSPEDMLGLAPQILGELEPAARPDVAWVGLRAPGHSWYPFGFMEPLERNQPWLDQAIATLAGGIRDLAAAGVAERRIVLLGFSQGACLATEYAARTPTRYGGVIGFSGGLIGPEGTARDYAGDLDGTPVFLGCSDRDPHIPESRVHQTAEVLASMGGEVTERIYPEMGHTVIKEEIDVAAAIVDRVLRDQA